MQKDTESISDYHPGGFHPTHLGDTFCDGRYTVVHKLGYGSSSTVWLVSDSQTGSYASLKILKSEKNSSAERAVLEHLAKTYDGEEEGSRHVARILDHFVHEGTNGQHLCIVGDVLGPSIAIDPLAWLYEDSQLPPDMARRFCGQIALGVAYLHKRGIAHGDLHPGNILLCLPRPWTSPEEVQRHLGTPRTKNFKPESEAKVWRHRPRYLVPATEMLANADVLRLCLQKPSIQICDFNESWMPGLPNPSPLATPRMFCPPEALVLNAPHAAPELDVWALAVLFHWLLAGCGLFPTSALNSDAPEVVLVGIASTLGPFPEPVWSAWDKRGKYFDEDGKPLDAGWKSTFLKSVVGESMPQGSEEHRAFEALLRAMTAYEPHDRASAQRVAGDRWITEFCHPHMGEDVEYVVEYLPSDDE
ncbi:Protein kinase [Mycena kentingensis (nom. inval.)]|nr:Protein kinase [Mycena kentingensis (nom. inval.)]